MSAPAEIPTIPWPTDEGIWMGHHEQLGWFPFQTKAMKDDLPSAEQLRLEREAPESAPPRRTLAILAQWLESDHNWPYTFQNCHPVKEWRKPTEDELKRARHFYRLDEPAKKE